VLKWKRDTIQEGLRKLTRPASLAALGFLAILGTTFGAHALAACAFAIALWIIAGSFAILTHRMRIGQVPLAQSLHLARITPRSVYGLVLAHAGIGITVAGITAMSAWKQEELRALPIGGMLDVGGYHVTLKTVENATGPNFQAERGIFEISSGGRFVTTLSTERRFYPVRRSQTTEAGIHTNLISNVYLAIGEKNGNEWTVRAYYHPLAPWIWFGPLVMALGGFVSLSDRRFRVGAPRRSRAAPAPGLVPAE
jgi:cytochrome c-type biogenesis protein CcmF